MPLVKTYSDDGAQCSVTFVFNNAPNARSVTLVAEFNSWERESLSMHRVDEHWELTVDLDAGEAYQYRYLVNGTDWFNDDDPDDYMAHPYGGENSVVQT
ncbi:MAG: glycoside hydrolase [Chloroflexi bacterium]|nr:glycoside hydrolase [Chloroflexota bacterium]